MRSMGGLLAMIAVLALAGTLMATGAPEPAAASDG